MRRYLVVKMIFLLSISQTGFSISFSYSQVGEKFRNRSLKFPGLISGCTMDWFSRWPKDALIAVSNHFLMNFEVVCSKETKQELVNSMGVVHDNVATICVEYFQRFVLCWTLMTVILNSYPFTQQKIVGQVHINVRDFLLYTTEDVFFLVFNVKMLRLKCLLERAEFENIVHLFNTLTW